jgi:heme/copper-type cytochrome/quinol oxidase subunit 2
MGEKHLFPDHGWLLTVITFVWIVGPVAIVSFVLYLLWRLVRAIERLADQRREK